jgi:acetyltransferase-like isoleucine patch superfamily enzyme
MTIAGYTGAMIRATKRRWVDAILSNRICARHPTLNCHPSALWDYGYHDMDAIEIGEDVTVAAFTEILIYKRSPNSAIEGRLILGDRSIIQANTNIRAAGGVIRVGVQSAVGQGSVVVAANHSIRPGEHRLRAGWDEHTHGVTIGDNVWVGASCVLLPGTVIGDNAVIAAGSVVRGTVPKGELWGGTPARYIRMIEPADA